MSKVLLVVTTRDDVKYDTDCPGMTDFKRGKRYLYSKCIKPKWLHRMLPKFVERVYTDKESFDDVQKWRGTREQPEIIMMRENKMSKLKIGDKWESINGTMRYICGFTEDNDTVITERHDSGMVIETHTNHDDDNSTLFYEKLVECPNCGHMLNKKKGK